MKAIFTLFSLLALLTSDSNAQFQNFRYTPKPDMNFMWRNNNFYYGNYSFLSERHPYKIVFKDGRDTLLYGKIQADSAGYSLVWTDKSPRHHRDGSGRIKRIHPSETRYIARMDKIENREYQGFSSDSCWLFEIIGGPVNAYSSMAEDDVSDEYLLYVQKGAGPMLTMNAENLEALLQTDEKALRLVSRKKYTRAIGRFNKDLSGKDTAGSEKSQVSNTGLQ